MNRPTPIAIVSRSCLFPGSLSPQSLWKNLLESRDLLTAPDPERWRTDPASAMGKPGWNNPGGYVTGFREIFDPGAYELDQTLVESLDPLFQWVLHTAHEAYHQIRRADQGKMAVLLGNLSLPSTGLAKWAESVWTGSERPHHLNRYMSGLPAHLVPRALGRRADAFSLDAACASSLYAIKLGCEKLRENRADIVLAGAVNRAEPLFLNIGFQALQALSPTGQSRPFHREADGLVPTEGAAFIGLKRLDDAIEHGDEILGVIHDVGLSNDGRSDGLLVPAGEGQTRAIRAAYDRIDIVPENVSYIECHATGTAVGDGREIKSLSNVFHPEDAIGVGSHKSNMGHAITAAGMAGLLKILGAFEHEILPPTIHCNDQIDTLEDAPFRVVTKPEPWNVDRRIAALSAFGFGGNNSHLVVEEWSDDRDLFLSADLVEANSPEIAVIGMGITSGVASNLAEFQRFLLSDDAGAKPLKEIAIPLEGLRFPPRDLGESLPQQLTILRAAIDAVGDTSLERERTGVFTGMQTDPDIVRHGLRARLAGDEARDTVAAPLTAAAVIGSLPNIVANRLNSHFDLGGYSFATSAEQHSGDVALREAFLALQRGELDAAIVGAVEMATDEAHREASIESEPLTDAAVVLVLKRRDQALEADDTILAILEEPDDSAPSTKINSPTLKAHSATGLLQIAAAIAVPEFALPRTGPAAGIRPSTTIETTALKAEPRKTTLRRMTRPVLLDAPKIYRVNHAGQTAIIVAATDDERVTKSARFKTYVDSGNAVGEGIYPCAEPLGGDTAQVFTGAAASYRGMGRALCLGFPDLVDRLAEYFDDLDVATRWMFHPDGQVNPTPLDKLFAASVLSQLHNDLTTRLLGIEFDAAIGFSSGETNALFATGVWRDFDGLLREFKKSGAFTSDLGGSFDVLKAAWANELAIDEKPIWKSVRITGPQEAVETAIADEPLAHLILKNAPDDVAIGGHDKAIDRIVATLEEHLTSSLDYDIAVHCPELDGYRETWLKLHTRETFATDVRLYSHAYCDHYEPTSDAVAQALLGQALNTVDFPALISKAWEDGVRVFIEHGPRTTLGPWISQILVDKPHRVVSLDSGTDDTLRPLANAIAQLASFGVDVDLDAYNEHLDAHAPKPDVDQGRMLSFPAHRPPIRLPDISMNHDDVTILASPPELPRVTESRIPPTPNQPRTSQPHPGVTEEQNLPQYFHLQRQAYESYLNVVATQTKVHQEFLDHSRRTWEQFNSSSSQNMNNRPPIQPSPPDAGKQEPVASPASGKPVGPTFTYEDLKVHASGHISEIFGPLFDCQDDFPRQVRMPEPPLLLADRVTGIDAEPGIVSTGTVWTETDIRADAWYLFNGHIPAGVMIEAGQADLLLISWMGADFENKGERIYRLLGCELTYRGGLPAAGDTLAYDIHIDGHANQGETRLFFFHYDCRVDGERRLSVRDGQAGFFTDEELANSMGILWTPETAEFEDNFRLDPPIVDSEQIPETLSAREVNAFADGDTTCFGSGYERLRTHTRTPNIDDDKMCLVGEVERIDPKGGPFARGYMRTTYELTPKSWFFDGHFKDDPCMPGTLMFEGGMQVMSLYMIALGHTLHRDGWRFEPVPDVPYQLRCRGQAIPTNSKLVYEIFIEEIFDGDEPTIVADILATVDGLKAFHCRGMQMRLVADVPHTEQLLVDGFPARDPKALCQDGLIHDQLALEATGIGQATMCMGEKYARFDGVINMPRLPGAPFQFMTRVISADGEPGDAKPGDSVIVEYEIPDSVWYFDENDRLIMPYAVLMEAALQPCGWFSLYSGAILDTDQPLYYRNLDGAATMHDEISPGVGTFQTHTTLTRDSRSGGMTIQSFDVECTIDGEVVYDLQTTFGFFPKEALENQVGLPVTDDERSQLEAETDYFVDLSTSPDPDHPDLWPADMLRMIDSATARWTDGKTTRYRTVKQVDPSEWFFKAHFFQDPVQPGSLGVEAMLQTLRFALIDGNYHRRFASPRIEPVALGEKVTWTYRGQVIPENKEITILLDLQKIVESDDETMAYATATLWADGLKIYSAANLVMRIASN